MKNRSVIAMLLCSGWLMVSLQAAAQQDTMRRYYGNLARSDKKEDKDKFQEALLRLQQSNEEKDLGLLVSMYGMSDQGAKADSLLKVVVARFPSGEMAQTKGYNDIILNGKTADGTLALYNKWVSKFPEPAESDALYDYARSQVVYKLLDERRIAEGVQWLQQLRFPAYKVNIKVSSALTIAGLDDTSTALKVLTTALADCEAAKTQPAVSGIQPYSDNDRLNANGAMASVLYKTGNYEEALKYATIAYADGANKKTSVKSIYALALAANDRNAEALPLMDELLKKGAGNADIRKVLKTVYTKVKGTAEGYEAYYTSLGVDLKKTITEGVIAKQIVVNDPAPLFAIKDLDGKLVNLADLKGKVVVLDFWATWCGPCKKSFPAMQMAVNKYKNDPGVKFLFIDCWEKVEDPHKEVKALMAKDAYSFHILMDLDKEGGVASKYNVKGIPAKFVIDKAGKLRFKISGFSGGDDAAVEEISAMIEVAKKS